MNNPLIFWSLNLVKKYTNAIKAAKIAYNHNFMSAKNPVKTMWKIEKYRLS